MIKSQQEEPKENEVEVLQKQVATLKPEDLKVLAEHKATEILSNIQRVSSKIDKAKYLTRQAGNVKGGLFGIGKTKEKTELNTKAIGMQNEAMAEMNTLIQESIKLTTISYGFAQAMTQTIAAMLENGFKDKDGDIQQLHGVAKEQALVMLDEAQRFVKHQQEYETRQEKQEEQISALQSGIAEHKQEYEKRQEKQEQDISTQREKIQVLQEQLESKRTKIKELESTLKSKGSLDDKQSQDIQTLQNELEKKREKIQELESTLEAKRLIDENQEAAINALQAQILALSAKKGVLNLSLAIIALALAMASLVLHFV
ncbi:hypothetical protein [Helicobacter sp.]|uniref:hypothetical protein n=1 Tax=Helicobacter sp. TaxID=218 RepID=UPI00388F0C7D